jgi:putative component of membrane protein insertase Oxa1/YidC/SpoIIIJ protein YidD
LKADSLVRKVLAAGIGFYRRRLSGRGPFKGVRCTFAQCESCSAYGERMIREAPTGLAALRRIVRRLQRCRHLSLFRFENGGLGQGSGYDTLLNRPSAGATLKLLDDTLAGDGECLPARQAVRQAALQVLVSAGAWPAGNAAMKKSPGLLVRDAAAVQRALARRLSRRTVLAVVAAGGGAMVWAVTLGSLLLVPLLLATFFLAASALGAHRLRTRLHRLEILNALEGP